MEIRDLRPGDALQVRALMESFGLSAPEGAEFGLGLFDGDRLMGCCQFKDGLIQGLAVDRDAQGEGLMARIVHALIQRAAARGVRSLGAVTKPEAAVQFERLGFRRIAGAEPHAVYLEFGRGGIEDEVARFHRAADGVPEPRAAIVLNANPFTLGHRHLIERAAAKNARVFALLVSEDASEFAAGDRLAMARAGTADLPNVDVLPGGPYIVSRRTFPAYFTRRQDLASAQGALDAALFAEVIAPALGVVRRYVGTEAASPTTAAYNRALAARLPGHGIELIEIPRLALGGEAVSASLVRAALSTGDVKRAREWVPASTAAFFESEAGQRAITRIRGGRA